MAPSLPHDAIVLLDSGETTVISLDHGLAHDARGTGYDVLISIEQAVGIRGTVPTSPHYLSFPQSLGLPAGATLTRPAAAEPYEFVVFTIQMDRR